MADRYISISRVFVSGDIEEWLQRYGICASANNWKEEEKALRIPTLLEKKSLAVYLDLNASDRKDYQAVKNALLNAFQPPEARFISLQEYERKKMYPGEYLQEFLYAIKRLLVRAIPEMDEGSREQLLLHMFLSGIPEQFSRSIRASTDVRSVHDTLQRVKP